MSYGDDIEATIESIADDRIICALDNYDPTDSYSFTHAVECIVDERVDNLTIDDIGARDYIDEAIGESITETLRDHIFTSDAVEDFDSAVLSVLQDQIDHNGPLDAPNNSDIERRVNDLEIQVASLLETNQRLLSALVKNSDYSLIPAPNKQAVSLVMGETVPAFPDFAAAAI
jgi:hypothetical protein